MLLTSNATLPMSSMRVPACIKQMGTRVAKRVKDLGNRCTRIKQMSLQAVKKARELGNTCAPYCKTVVHSKGAKLAALGIAATASICYVAKRIWRHFKSDAQAERTIAAMAANAQAAGEREVELRRNLDETQQAHERIQGALQEAHQQYMDETARLRADITEMQRAHRGAIGMLRRTQEEQINAHAQELEALRAAQQEEVTGLRQQLEQMHHDLELSQTAALRIQQTALRTPHTLIIRADGGSSVEGPNSIH